MRCNQLKIHQFAHTSEKPFKLVNLCSANNFFYILCIVLKAKWAKQISKWLTNKLNSILQCMQGWQKAKIRGLRLLAIQDPIINFFLRPKISYIPFSHTHQCEWENNERHITYCGPTFHEKYDLSYISVLSKNSLEKCPGEKDSSSKQAYKCILLRM